MIREKGYTMCLNAGTVMWYRHSYAYKILKEWWDSSLDSYTNNPLNRKFRLNWPWEQDRQMAIYNRSSEYIQITSHPHLPHMPWGPQTVSDTLSVHTKKKHKNKKNNQREKTVLDWCFSHLPGSGCYISHHCAHSKSKQVLRKKYNVDYNHRYLYSVEALKL